jgi:hypothetical protein
MYILNSDWLISMLKKASSTPQGRMLSLFDILEDWLDAPHFNHQLPSNQLPSNQQQNSHQLQDFLTLEAAKAGAAMPEILAQQLYFMAIAAAQEKLSANTPGHPLSNSLHAFDSPCNHASLSHAKSAAKALILAQTKPEFHIAKSSAYAIAASFIGVFVVAGSAFLYNFNANIAPKYVHVASAPSLLQARVSSSTQANPQQTAALIAQIEQMRKGNCQLIEALQLPDSYKKVYFENIVSGQISTNLSDQKLVNELLQKVRCNYSPMLMENSR